MTKRLLFLLPLLLAGVISFGQFKISGTVTDDKNKPIKGANVYLENTIDGGTTDSMGIFTFTTSEKGPQTVVASEVTHATAGQPVTIAGDVSGIVIVLKANKAHDLEGVVITAGSFGALNDKTKTVLNPLDIVTTAGSGADVVKAMEMLPGTQKTSTENGMFVRGGDATEAAIVVDEMIVQNAFFSGPPGMATRSRFNAFQYNGVAFSSGGYSARYGQALSGILELNSIDLAEKSTVNLGLHMAGIYASGTKKWKNSSFDIGGNYTNTTPFFSLAATNYTFKSPPTGAGANMRYVWKPNKDGILKINVAGSTGKSTISIPDSIPPANVDYQTHDLYFNGGVSYKQMFKSKYMLYTAASYSLDSTDNKFSTIPLTSKEHRAQYRIEGKDFVTSRLTVLAGADVQNFGVGKEYNKAYRQSFDETLIAGYGELEWMPVNMIAIKPGIRYEQSTLLKEGHLAPRLSMAVKTGKHSQASVAGGVFYQDGDYAYLEAGLRPEMAKSVHYIANWQYTYNDRTLRLEGYYKSYDKLISTPFRPYDPTTYSIISDTTTFNNHGHGYAQGLELFWRDKKTFKNVDYWVSYSYINTKRQYGSYPAEVTPTFISDHNLNLVGKYFVDKWKTNFSLTYSFATGRPYYDPGKPMDGNSFLSDRTPDYHNLAISVAYLHTFGKWFTVFYVSIDNVTNQHNVFGYRYVTDAASPTGFRQAGPIVPALYRAVFVGVNMSLTQFSKDEL